MRTENPIAVKLLWLAILALAACFVFTPGVFPQTAAATPSPATAQEWWDWFGSQKTVVEKVVKEGGTTVGVKHGRTMLSMRTLPDVSRIPVKFVFARTDYIPIFRGKAITGYADQGTSFSISTGEYTPPAKPDWVELTTASASLEVAP